MSSRLPIDRTDLLSLLSDLIAIKSVNPMYEEGSNESRIADYIGKYFERIQVPWESSEALPNRCNVVGKLQGSDGNRCLLFVGHMDTVSTTGMTIDPFKPECREGRIYGRGACDMKAGLAAALYALKLLKQHGVRPAASIVVAATVDEEFACRGVCHLIRSGLKADGAMVCEPTELNVATAQKGWLCWRINTKGKSAHSSRSELGINAITKTARLLQAIEGELVPLYRHRPHPLLGVPKVNVGVIGGGVRAVIVPDSCMIEIDRRTLPGESKESVWEEFTTLLNKLKARDPQFEAAMEEPLMEGAPFETNAQERIVQITREACSHVLGQVRTVGFPGGTEASQLSAAGIPSVILGPGSVDQAHAAEEFVAMDQVVKAVEIYVQAMMSF